MQRSPRILHAALYILLILTLCVYISAESLLAFSTHLASPAPSRVSSIQLSRARRRSHPKLSNETHFIPLSVFLNLSLFNQINFVMLLSLSRLCRCSTLSRWTHCFLYAYRLNKFVLTFRRHEWIVNMCRICTLIPLIILTGAPVSHSLPQFELARDVRAFARSRDYCARLVDSFGPALLG